MQRDDDDEKGARGDVIEVEVDGVRLLAIDLPPVPLPSTLSPAEREVIRLLLRGDSQQDIAAARGTSAATVANQLASVYAKLGVNSRGELLAKLLEHEQDGGEDDV